MSNPRPNILWLFLEDMNPWMSCYGDHTIQTPNIDALAASGVKFDRRIKPRAYARLLAQRPLRECIKRLLARTTTTVHTPFYPKG